MSKCSHCQSESFRPGSKVFTVICNQCNKEQVKRKWEAVK